LNQERGRAQNSIFRATKILLVWGGESGLTSGGPRHKVYAMDGGGEGEKFARGNKRAFNIRTGR